MAAAAPLPVPVSPMSSRVASVGDALQQREDLPHRLALADQRAKPVLRRRRDGHGRERGLQAQQHVADLDQRARRRYASRTWAPSRKVPLVEPRSAPGSARRAADQVVAADRGVVDDEVVVRRLADLQRGVGDGERLPHAVGVHQHQVELLEAEALVLGAQAQNGVCGNGRGGTGRHSGRGPFYGVRHAAKGPPLQRSARTHPRAQRRPGRCGSPIGAGRLTPMGRGERRRSLTVVGGARGEVARYASLLPEAGGPVLVLGVADGRLAESLVRRGVPVTGVDPSPRMIARAEETRAGLPGELQGQMQLLRADLRSLRLSQRFAAVFAPRDAVALVATRASRRCSAPRASTSSPGRASPSILSLPPVRWLLPDDVDPHEGVQPERAVFTPHLRSRRTREGHAGLHRLLLRHFTAREVDHALAGAGLEPLTRDRDFEGRAWEPGADRMVVVAQARPAAGG